MRASGIVEAERLTEPPGVDPRKVLDTRAQSRIVDAAMLDSASSARLALIRILKRAYSGELAAAYAYRGHWKSLSLPDEIESIKKIENDEWVHRRAVGRMLQSLDSRPQKLREARLWLVGKTIGAACHLIGWFFPMYFAGRLESGNSVEYETAAYYARQIGFADFQRELLLMAEVERAHEMYFLNAVAGHRLLPMVSRIFKWRSAGDEAVRSVGAVR